MGMTKEIFLLTAALICPLSVGAVEIMEFEGGAHGFPALLDGNGKKLADGEFYQWLEDGRLHITISYRFSSGQRIEEKAVLQQKPELIQDEWAWREIKDGQLQREFKIDFKSQMAAAQKRKSGEMKNWSQKIDIQRGRAFAGFGFTLT